MRRLSNSIRNKLSGSLTRLKLRTAAADDLNFLNADADEVIKQTYTTQQEETKDMSPDIKQLHDFVVDLNNLNISTSIIPSDEKIKAFVNGFNTFNRTMKLYADYLEISQEITDVMSKLKLRETPLEDKRDKLAETFEDILKTLDSSQQQLIFGKLKGSLGKNVGKLPYLGFGDDQAVRALLSGDPNVANFDFLGNIDLINYYFQANGKNLFREISSISGLDDSVKEWLAENSEAISIPYESKKELTTEILDIMTGKIKLDDVCLMVWRELGSRIGSESLFSRFLSKIFGTESPQQVIGNEVRYSFKEEITKEKIDKYAQAIKNGSVSSLIAKYNNAKTPESKSFFERCVVIRKALELKNRQLRTGMFLDEDKIRENIRELFEVDRAKKVILSDINSSIFSGFTVDQFNYFLGTLKGLIDDIERSENKEKNNNDPFDVGINATKTPNRKKEILVYLLGNLQKLDPSQGDFLPKIKQIFSQRIPVSGSKILLTSQEVFSLLNMKNYRKDPNFLIDGMTFEQLLDSRTKKSLEFFDFLPKDKQLSKEIMEKKQQRVEEILSELRVSDSGESRILTFADLEKYQKEQKPTFADLEKYQKEQKPTYKQLYTRFRNNSLTKRNLLTLPMMQNKRTRLHSKITDQIGSFGGSIQARTGQYGIDRMNSELMGVIKLAHIAGFAQEQQTGEQGREKINSLVSIAKEVPKIKEDLISKETLLKGNKEVTGLFEYIQKCRQLLKFNDAKFLENLGTMIRRSYSVIQTLNRIVTTSNSFGSLFVFTEEGPQLNEGFVEKYGHEASHWTQFQKNLRELISILNAIKNTFGITREAETNIVSKLKTVQTEFKDLVKKVKAFANKYGTNQVKEESIQVLPVEELNKQKPVEQQQVEKQQPVEKQPVEQQINQSTQIDDPEKLKQDINFFASQSIDEDLEGLLP